jgi:aminoglycoside phosphotransferase (APT) family kinase protein
VVVDPDRGRIVAVLDWEMATLGDPLADLASTVVWWDGMRGLDTPVAAIPADVHGYPDSGELVAAYARQSGLDLAPLPWYLGFAFFKIAAIFEGIHFRARQGLTLGEGFERLGDLVPPLVERGHAALADLS